MMKHNDVSRILSGLLAVTFMLTACGRASGTTDTAAENGNTAQGDSKALIAYFTVAENSGVDAVASASRFSGTIETIKELEPDATVIEDGFTVSERDVADAAEDVAEWLDGLGY